MLKAGASAAQRPEQGRGPFHFRRPPTRTSARPRAGSMWPPCWMRHTGKGPLGRRVSSARYEPGRPAPALLTSSPALLRTAFPCSCAALLPVEHSLASRPLHLLFLVSVVLRNPSRVREPVNRHTHSLSQRIELPPPHHTHTLSLCLSLREQNYLPPHPPEHTPNSAPYPVQFFSISLRTI